MNEPTKKQEEALREFLHSGVVPLIEDVLVKKLVQAMSYVKEQIATPKQWVGMTDEEYDKCDAHETWRSMQNVAQMLKEKNT